MVLVMAGTTSAHAQRAGVVLRLPASVRAAGASDAALLVDGADAVFYGAADIPASRAASVNAGSWIGGASFGTVAVSAPLVGHWSVAFGVQALDYGSAEEVVPDPLTGGARGMATGNTIGASEVHGVLGVGRAVRWLHVGATVGYARQSLADASTDAATLGLAAMVQGRGWRAGIAAQNLSGGFTYGGRAEAIGASMRAMLVTPAVHAAAGAVRGLAEYRSTSGGERVALAGAEGTWTTREGWMLQARAAGAASSVSTARAPWSAGGSAGRGAWALDYAYQGFGALGAAHRMGVTWHARAARFR